MNYFTEPNGKFILQIPEDWRHVNVVARMDSVSPFCFESDTYPNGSFQISCYSFSDKQIAPPASVQATNTSNLNFSTKTLKEDNFQIQLWRAAVSDHFFLAKYISDSPPIDQNLYSSEIRKVEQTLSTLQLISEDLRETAVNYNKYENFISSLAASFDLRMKAMENNSLIELIVIIANQIDAYLRMSLVLVKQLTNLSSEIDTTLLFQGENDPPIMERKIYTLALDNQIIDRSTYDSLELLYKDRNKVIHRYIISEFKTVFLSDIALGYHNICELIRLKLQSLEEQQSQEGIGIYSKKLNSSDDNFDNHLKNILLKVKDKHQMNFESLK